MSGPGISTEKTTAVNTEEATRVYKQEVALVVISALIVMVVGIGVIFMQPFPRLLDITIWGFPFPYWYQLTINWIGPIVFGFFIIVLLGRNDDAKERLDKGGK